LRLLLLRLRLATRSTLSPYTTLFRSCHGQLIANARELSTALDAYWRPAVQRFDLRAHLPQRLRHALHWPLHERAVPDELAVERLDRKSTRLNSSHVKISYAVFCLKKK